MADTLLNNAINAWKWLADPSNSEPVEPLIDNDEARAEADATGFGDALVPLDARRFSTNALHKQVFGRQSKTDLNVTLRLLQEAGVVGIPFSQSSGGRPKEFRHVSAEWLCVDNPDAAKRLETKLTELLVKVLYVSQANHYAEQVADSALATEVHAAATEVHAAEETTVEVPTNLERPTDPNQLDPKIELAIKSFDWFADPENYEIDNTLRPFFSVERLRRALAVDKTELEEALNLLQWRVLVVTNPERDLKGREIRFIQQPWLKSGREKLINTLKPEPPKPHVPFGPARVLRTVNVYVGSLFMTFKENEIVRNEAHIIALLKAGAILARLEDESARMCANPKCRHRFDLSESSSTDFPVLEAIKRDYIQCGVQTLCTNPGDWITDRSQCLHLTTGALKERTKHTFRELPSDAYICCPNCKHVSKNNADLLQKIS